MDDKKINKITDKNSSSDEAETNNGRFPQRMQGAFTLYRDLRNEDKAKKSAQRKQKSLCCKDCKCSSIVSQELKDAKSKRRYLSIKELNLDEISSSSCDESNASSSSTDNESAGEKKVAHHNPKYSKNSKSPNINESNLYSTCRPACDHASTSFADSFAVPRTSVSDTCAVQSTSSSDSCEDPSRSSSDTYEITSTSFSDTSAVPSTRFSREREDLKNTDLIRRFGDLGIENFSEKCSVEAKISDCSDVESPTEMVHYTYRKRKALNKSHRPIHEHDTELKKRRFETPRREPHMKPFHLPIRKYSSEEDVLIDAKRKLKMSSSSEDDKRCKEIKKRPISEKEHSSPETQGSSHSFKKSKRFRTEGSSESEEEKRILFTKSI